MVLCHLPVQHAPTEPTLALLTAVLEPPPGEETGQAGVNAQQQGASSSGGGGGSPTAPAEISWDIDLSAAAGGAGESSAAFEQTAAPAGISWDIDSAAADSAAADGAAADSAAAAVDWDVQMDGDGAGDDTGAAGGNRIRFCSGFGKIDACDWTSGQSTTECAMLYFGFPQVVTRSRQQSTGTFRLTTPAPESSNLVMVMARLAW